MKTLIIQFCAVALTLAGSTAWAIKKCQDADGNWYYGDTEVRRCENSKVTTLNNRGFVEHEREAPKTEQQIREEAEQQADIERQRAGQLKAEREKLRILGVYETTADIDRQRDNQIRSVQSNIDVHTSYLERMRERVAKYKTELAETKSGSKKKKLRTQITVANQRIEQYSVQLAELLEQKVAINQQFEQEKQAFLKFQKAQD